MLTVTKKVKYLSIQFVKMCLYWLWAENHPNPPLYFLLPLSASFSWYSFVHKIDSPAPGDYYPNHYNSLSGVIIASVRSLGACGGWGGRGGFLFWGISVCSGSLLPFPACAAARLTVLWFLDRTVWGHNLSLY